MSVLLVTASELRDQHFSCAPSCNLGLKCFGRFQIVMRPVHGPHRQCGSAVTLIHWRQLLGLRKRIRVNGILSDHISKQQRHSHEHIRSQVLGCVRLQELVMDLLPCRLSLEGCGAQEVVRSAPSGVLALGVFVRCTGGSS